MPVFQVRQVISHDRLPLRHEKVTMIIGRDLRHAIEQIKVPAPMKRDLEKKFWTRTIDPKGRELYIEIIHDRALGSRGMR